MKYKVFFSPESEADLVRTYRYIARKGFPENAAKFTDALTAFCLELQGFPNRGALRENLRAGLRILGYKGQAKYRIRSEPKQRNSDHPPHPQSWTECRESLS